MYRVKLSENKVILSELLTLAFRRDTDEAYSSALKWFIERITKRVKEEIENG